MKLFFTMGIILLSFVQQVQAQRAADYSQSYAVLIKGVLAGHEKVSESVNEAGQLISVSEHELIVSDGLVSKSMAFSTRMVFSKDGRDPLSYTYAYAGESGDSYDVTIKDGQISRLLRRGGRTSDVTVPFQPGMVILDFNVYHQYDYLLRKYDIKKGGRQSFADFVPIIGSDIPIYLTYLGDSTFECKKGTIPVKDYRIEFIGIYMGQVSVDNNGRLVRLQIPNQDLEVLREDLFIK